MKSLIKLTLVSIIFISCSESPAEEGADYESVDVDETYIDDGSGACEEAAIEEDIDETGVTVVPDYDENWGIDDFVDFIYKQDITETGDFENGGAGHYYEVIDEKGGYATVTGAYEGSSTYVLWRMANGDNLIGITSMGCGPVCSYDYEFKQFGNGAHHDMENGEYLDVTNSILPKPGMDEHFKSIEDKMNEKYPNMDYAEGEYMFNLPQKGTSIEVWISMDANGFEFPIMTLSWDKHKFSIEEKYSELP